jgi:hypothetical protein
MGSEVTKIRAAFASFALAGGFYAFRGKVLPPELTVTINTRRGK